MGRSVTKSTTTWDQGGKGTLVHGHLTQSVLNVKPEVKEETEEEKEQKHKTFVEKYEKQIKHFDHVPLLLPYLHQTCESSEMDGV
ncbi:hypothetical protein MHYP_G00105810 [Metynnis hypsauchen]